MKKTIVHMAVAVSAMMAAGQMAQGAQLLQFHPTPASPGLPEFSWTSGTFAADAGSVGNGDGALPVALQTAPGLEVDVNNLSIPGVVGSSLDAGGTQFYDCTLILQGINANGPGYLVVSSGQASQSLTPGEFVITSTTGELLLTGSLTNNAMAVTLGSQAAGVQTGVVTYTGGKIYNALVAAGYSPNNGSSSIALTALPQSSIPVTDLGPVIPGVLDAMTIGNFLADGTGTMTVVVPEPASLSLLGLVGILACRRRRA